MALSFNCGQYEQAFNSKRLQNWEERNVHRKRPTTKEGYTQIIASDRGHLLPSIPRASRSPWGTFVGTWDLPKQIPGNKQFDPTARSADAHFRQLSSKKEADVTIYGGNKYRRTGAGQPVEGMSAECPDSTLRSGAANPQVKGTPNRAELARTYSAKFTAVQPPMDTISQELVYPYSSQPLHTSPVNGGRMTPPRLPSARASPQRASPTKPPSARASRMKYSPVRLSPVNDARISSPLDQIPQSRQAPLTPNVASPKPRSAAQRLATPPQAEPQAELQQQDEAPVPVV